MKPLQIQSGQGDYEVVFATDLGEVVARVKAVSRAVLAIDRRILELYGRELEPLTGALPTLALDATEQEKTLAGIAKLCGWLQKVDANKQTTLVAVGGGIIQDICTFSAHVYYRGINWLFVPTTLLSMSDSCIGAKCGINLNEFKNQLGVFQSPAAVIVCPKFIDTLADSDVASGYGEILKLMVTGSADAFRELCEAVAEAGLRGPRLTDLIRASLVVKKGVIEEDEYERDRRRILNYGHTFGHALESITRHEISHGLAVAWGMDLVNFLSWKRGLLAEREFVAVHDFVRQHLPFRLSRKIEANELIDGARRDKKMAHDGLNLVLTEGAGALKIVKVKLDATLHTEVADYLDRFDVYRCD